MREATATPTDWLGSRHWVLVTVLLGAAATVLHLSTGPGRWTLWAEDGSVFLQDAWSGDSSLAQPYAGYLHLVPRLLALGSATLPLPLVPFATAILAVTAASVVAYFCVHRVRSFLTSTWTRCAFGVLLVVGPAATEEVGGNLANLHWVLTLGAVLAIWAPATSGGWRDFAGGAVCLAAGMSDPLAALALIPLAGRFVLEFRRDDALLRTVAGSTRVVTAGVALPVAMLATSLTVQVAVSLASPRPMRGIPTARGLVELVLSYWGPQALMGRVLAGGAALVLSVPVVFVGGVVAVLVVWVASIRIVAGSNLLSLAIVSAVAVVVPLAMNWNPGLLDVRFPSGTGRYAFLPASLTALAGLLLADQRMSWRGRKVGELSAGVMLLGVLAGLAYPSFVSRGPEWRTAVDDAQVDCPVGGSAPVPIAPDGWVVQVPCALM